MTTIYDVLRRPLVTEKSNYQSGKLHQYTFRSGAATKTMVKGHRICLTSQWCVNVEHTPNTAVLTAAVWYVFGVQKAIITLQEMLFRSSKVQWLQEI